MALHRGSTRQEMEKAGRALKKKVYICVCGAILKHDEVYPHKLDCPNRLNKSNT